MYSGGEPQFVEGDVFRITVPLSEVATATVGSGSFIASSDGTVSEPISEAVNGTANGTVNGTVNLSQNEKNILTEIQKNPHVTKREMCSILDIGTSTVARATKKLKNSGMIKRVGSAKTGYWKVSRC